MILVNKLWSVRLKIIIPFYLNKFVYQVLTSKLIYSCFSSQTSSPSK